MLDPLSALSVAGAIVQFVQFSSKLISKGHELYKSTDGASLGHAELETIAKDLQELNGRLSSPAGSKEGRQTNWKDSGDSLTRLSEQCSVVASELIATLGKLKVEGPASRRWKSLRQALKCLLQKSEVEALAARLQYLRDEIDFHILVSMR